MTRTAVFVERLNEEGYQMTRVFAMVAGFLVFGTYTQCAAIDGAHPSLTACCANHPAKNYTHARFGCPNDYCRKPVPCVAFQCHSASCDNYCRKPVPCTQSPRFCVTNNDYCRKPFTQPCKPSRFDFLKCIPLNFWTP